MYFKRAALLEFYNSTFLVKNQTKVTDITAAQQYVIVRNMYDEMYIHLIN